MATAEELLARTATAETEPHIVIGNDRTVTVPPELRNIAVQFDHNIETVIFDCPRYWDEHDLSKMKVFVNYIRADGQVGQYLCTNVSVDLSDETIIHFRWTIKGHVTEAAGLISFLVCAKVTDEAGNLQNRWSSLLNQEMSISKGVDASTVIAEMQPDVITAMLLRLDNLENGPGVGIDWDRDVDESGHVLNRPLYLDYESIACGDYALQVGDSYRLASETPIPGNLVGGKLKFKRNNEVLTWPIIGYCETINDMKQLAREYGSGDCIVVVRGDAFSFDALDYYLYMPATSFSIMAVINNPATAVPGTHVYCKQYNGDIYTPVELTIRVPAIDGRYKSLFKSNIHVINSSTTDATNVDLTAYSPGDIILLVVP